MPYKILVADDEPDTLDLCSKVLEKEGYEVFTAKDGLEALKMIRDNTFALLLLDIRMPGKNGMEVLEEATAIGMDTVMITAYSSVETAVEAIKKGASDYLVKPFAASDIRSVVKKVISQQKPLMTEANPTEVTAGFELFVGDTPAMKEVYRIIKQ